MAHIEVAIAGVNGNSVLRIIVALISGKADVIAHKFPCVMCELWCGFG